LNFLDVGRRCYFEIRDHAHRVLVSHEIDFVKGKERLGEGSGYTRQATDSIVGVFLGSKFVGMV